jgi:steroid 5-alpha reductase family enzyme
MLSRMSPLTVILLVSGAACAFAWLASLVSGDTSWVDRSWSILPVIYVWIFASAAHLDNARLDVMAALVSVWGARLTFNFARKGGYSGVEDYRWGVLRSSMPKWQFQLFNLYFIVIYQNVILVLLALPAWTAYQNRDTAFSVLDAVLAAAFLAFTITETVADEQQWRFQTWKRDEIAAGRSPSPRFVESGLFRYSRHPNYFFEIAQWWIFFLFAAVAAQSVLQWSVIGALLLSLLFGGSTAFTEKITLSRYPEYALYQQRTSAIVPRPARPAPPAVPVVEAD